MQEADVVRGKIVKHYKPTHGYYEILAVGRDTERSWRRLVAYQALKETDGKREVWIRPLTIADKLATDEAAFCEPALLDGLAVERFTYTGVSTITEIQSNPDGRLIFHCPPGAMATIHHSYSVVDGKLQQNPDVHINLDKR